MKINKKTLLGLSFLAFGAFSFLVCSYDGVKSDAKEIETSIQNTTYLVSLKGTQISLGEEGVEATQNQFEKELKLFLGVDNYTITRTFPGINVVEVRANSKYEELLSTLTNVTHVAVDQTYTFEGITNSQRTQEQIEEGYVPYASTTVNVSSTDEDANQSAISMNIPSSTNGGAGTLIAILDTGYLMDHKYFEAIDETDSIKLTYSSLSEKAASGDMVATQRANVSQGDEGSLWYSNKIPFYYDYGGSSSSSANDYDVLSQVSEHGTHVASIAAANGSYTGIAPNAQLALMKVFYEYVPTSDTASAYTYASDSDILEALNDCVILGVDVLNMSLGSVMDDFDTRSSSMEVIDKLSEDGVVCAVSAGNAGKAMYSSLGGYKAWTTDMVDTGVIGSYSNNENADVIASSTTEKLFYENGLKLGNNVIGYADQVDYSDGSDGIMQSNEKLLHNETENIEDLELVIIKSNDGESTIGLSADYTAVRNAAGGDTSYFNNKIAVVDRGTTSFVDKATAAENAGCAALIVINNDPTAYEFNFSMSWSSDGSYDIPQIPVVFVLYQDRDTIWNYCQEYAEDNDGDDATVYHAPVEVIQNELSENPNAYEMSNFSSEGAKYDLTMIPTISAPGSSIRGATIGTANSQGVYTSYDTESVGYLSGTSMASPNYAGVIALMIGEYDKDLHGDQDDYVEDITSRLMSTANVYTHEVTTYGTIAESTERHSNSTPTDTSDDYDVTVYVPVEEETVTETVPYSPRKQGAGVVDVSKALAADVYLEGLDMAQDGTYDETKDEVSGEYNGAKGFAKIELKNNDKLKNDGELEFKVLAHNTSNSTKTYEVEFSLMTPQLTSYHSSENEKANYVSDEAQFEGAQVSSDNDSYRIMNLGEGEYTSTSVLTTSYTLKSSVSIPSGTNVIDLGSYTLTDEQKAFITDNFENGTYVEGYITLTEIGVGAGQTADTLNVPYMGFYGEYGEADAVEPFAFEKEETYDRTTNTTDGKLYGSDLVNYLGRDIYGKSSMDVGSIITATSYSSYQSNNTARSAMIQNNNTPYSFGSSPATTYDEDTGEYTLYLGGDNSDVLYIQQFVYRSLESATVEVIDFAGKTVKTKALSTMYYNTSYLYKSLVNTNLISSYIISERGYCELPLYYDNGAKINDGEYTLKFTYNLMYGSTQTKEYNLVIDTGAPELVSKSIVYSGTSAYVRLQFDEIYINKDSSASIIINAGLLTNYTYSETSNGFIIDIPYDENTFYSGKLHVSLYDGARNYARYMINEADLEETGLFVQSSSLGIGYNYSYTETDNLVSSYDGNINRTYEVSFTDYTGSEVDIGTYDAYITFNKSVSSYVAVYGINEDGSETRIRDISLLNDSQTLKITTNYTSFRVEDVSVTQTTITGGSVSISASENGSVYVDKTSGFVGDKITIYAIPDSGYEVESVTVNGVSATKDSYGNYYFYLSSGQNIVAVTFIAS